MNFVQATLFVIFILFSSGYAMENGGIENPDLFPPTITYKKYVNILSLGERIDGWGEPSGNLVSWLQIPANRLRVQNFHIKPLEDFPFFTVTLRPEIENSKLRADYYLPLNNFDNTNGLPTLSIFRDATENERNVVQRLTAEEAADTLLRLIKWQKDRDNLLNARNRVSIIAINIIYSMLTLLHTPLQLQNALDSMPTRIRGKWFTNLQELLDERNVHASSPDFLRPGHENEGNRTETLYFTCLKYSLFARLLLGETFFPRGNRYDEVFVDSILFIGILGIIKIYRYATH